MFIKILMYNIKHILNIKNCRNKLNYVIEDSKNYVILKFSYLPITLQGCKPGAEPIFYSLPVP